MRKILWEDIIFYFKQIEGMNLTGSSRSQWVSDGMTLVDREETILGDQIRRDYLPNTTEYRIDYTSHPPSNANHGFHS